MGYRIIVSCPSSPTVNNHIMDDQIHDRSFHTIWWNIPQFKLVHLLFFVIILHAFLIKDKTGLEFSEADPKKMKNVTRPEVSKLTAKISKSLKY